MEEYETLRVGVDGAVAFVTIDDPPVNLLDVAILGDLVRLPDDLLARSVRVAVFRSADPEFFIAHADLDLIRQLPRDVTELGLATPGLGDMSATAQVT
jgi:enoyl-CoA hydratase/carnithine racemase